MLAPAAAAAEELPPPPCGLLERADGVSRAGVDLGYSFVDTPPEVDLTAVRVDLHGQWLHPDLGLGGYAILPLSYGRVDPEVGATNAEWVLGDVELGAVARRRLTPVLEAAGHLGVSLPTAPEGTFTATEISGFANEFAIWARPNDLALAYQEASFLRAGVSPILRSGQLFARGDLGVDVPLHSGVDEDLVTIGHLGGAVGALVAGSAFMVEVMNLIAVEDPEGDDEDRVVTFLGLSAAFTVADRWQPTASLVLPLDDEINDAIDMALVVGVQALLP